MVGIINFIVLNANLCKGPLMVGDEKVNNVQSATLTETKYNCENCQKYVLLVEHSNFIVPSRCKVFINSPVVVRPGGLIIMHLSLLFSTVG